MARKLPKKDVVIIGLGWTGSIIANELTDEGLDVVAIERGPWRDAPTEYPPSYVQDELRYRIRHELFLRPEQTTFTFRNKMDQTALPIRTWGAFMPPNGVGGGGVHWNAETWRFLPSDFVLKPHLIQRYGAARCFDEALSPFSTFATASSMDSSWRTINRFADVVLHHDTNTSASFPTAAANSRRGGSHRNVAIGAASRRPSG